MNNEEYIEEIHGPVGPPCITNYSQIKEFHLNAEILDPAQYTGWINAINHSCEMDLVHIYINSGGGNLFTAIQLVDCIKKSPATFMATVQGACMSAATLIFLACDQHAIAPHSAFLFHNYSGGAVGKGGEMYNNIIHQRKWIESLLRDSYNGFLHDDEVDNLLDDKDIWMSAEEVEARLTNRKEQKNAEIHKEPAKTKKPSKRKLAKTKTKTAKAKSKT